jgi:cysteine synthase A
MSSRVVQRWGAAVGLMSAGTVGGIWLERNRKEWIPSMSDEVVDIVGAIGNTPLLEIKSLSQKTGCRILAKAEFLNPSGSVKDRAAKFLIESAERQGKIAPRGTIVEPTGGNTGIGLALVSASKGYRTIFTMPSNTSREKVELMKILGAEAHVLESVPMDHPQHFYKVAKRILSNKNDAFMPDQFENTANLQAHYEGTGPEIWRQVRGKVHGFVTSSGQCLKIEDNSCVQLN